MPNVGFVRENLRPYMEHYERIRDCIKGQAAIKKRTLRYLPNPEPDDCSKVGVKRYNDYVMRAVFYNVTAQTLKGLSGQVFMRDPVVKVPPRLDPIVADATGSGVPLQQIAVQCCNNGIAMGRGGLYVDYPSTPTITPEDGGQPVAATTIAQIEAGDVRPTITAIDPENIINYRVMRRGAKIILRLVVFKEERITGDDGFEQKKKEQYRVLRLDETGYYVNEVYYNKMGLPDEQYFPTDAAGNRLDEIPFSFIGAENNDPDPDEPPLLAMADLNIAHYRNSAEFEDSLFIVGQPTPVFVGLTEAWAKEVLGDTIRLGSRGAIPLPVGGDAKLLQAEPNTMAKEGMDQKEAQMLALGAKLIEASQVQRTATEADYDSISETSVLSTVAKNVGQAIKWALEWCCIFVGVPEEIEYELNTEFDLVKMTPDERRQLVSEWQANAISFTEMRDNLRRGGVASQDDKVAQAEIEQQMQQDLTMEQQRLEMQTEVTGAPNDNPGAA